MRKVNYKKRPQNITLLVRVLLVIAVGLIALRLTHATTPTASAEAEGGVVSTGSGGLASRVANSTASDSAAIKFGVAPINPSNYTTRWTQVSPFDNPIHFIDTYVGSPGPFKRIEIDVTIEQAGGTDGYYFSNQINFPNTPSCTPDCIAYMGLQTVGARSLPPGGTVDKMAIFSVWNSTYSIPVPGVTAINFDGEGIGKSLRIAYDWQVGKTYRMSMWLNDTFSNATDRYWAASILDVATNTETILGNILLPSGLSNADSSGFFHERYSGPIDSCAQMNPSQVKISNTRVLSSDATPASWKSIDNWAIYQANVTMCNSSFWVKDLPGAAIRSGVNTPSQ